MIYEAVTQASLPRHRTAPAIRTQPMTHPPAIYHVTECGETLADVASAYGLSPLRVYNTNLHLVPTPNPGYRFPCGTRLVIQ